MKNNQLAELQAKREELDKAIKDKQKEIDRFDVTEYYGEDDYKRDMREELGIADVLGADGSLYHIDILCEMRYTTFRKTYNDYIDSLGKNYFKEYRDLGKELEELENELLDIEDQLEQLENNRLAELQAKRYKRYKLIKAIRAKQEELDCFDVGENYDEDMFIKHLGGACDKVIFMGREYDSIETMQKVDSSAFHEMYNDHIDSLDESDFGEYRELGEELKELENKLSDIEKELEELENE